MERREDIATGLTLSLSGEINTATRSLHTTLNRLITSRLPLALPPNTSDRSLYATGLLHFSHIFLTFESLWADILRDHAAAASSTTPQTARSIPPPSSPLLSYLLVNPYDSPTFFTSTPGLPTPPSPHLASFLQNLLPRGLPRSARLKRDLARLLDLYPTDLDVLLAKYPGDKVAEFCAHIRRSVREKPWVLVAYAWCFYMAVFSGGRWIRSVLLEAGQEFWAQGQNHMAGAQREGEEVDLKERGLSFWHFAGQHDGEDIKAAFKANLLGAESLFSPDERVDVIEEAKNIFRFCAELIDELDSTVVGTSGPDQEKDAEPQPEDTVKEKETVLIAVAEIVPPNEPSKKIPDSLALFRSRPEVTGTLVALACLAGVVLLRSW